MTTFETPLDINEGSRATPGLWNRISDAHWNNYNAIDDRIDALNSAQSSAVITEVISLQHGPSDGIIFRKESLSGSTQRIWSDTQNGGIAFGTDSNTTHLYVQSNRAIFGPVLSANSRLVLRIQDIDVGSTIVDLGNQGFGLGGKLTGNRPYLALNSDRGEQVTISGYTVNFRQSRKPATSTSAGSTGDFSFTSQHVYFCISASSWKRAALSGY